MSAPTNEAAGSSLTPEVSVVAPCFNEQDNLSALLDRVSKACQEAIGDRYEILLVDDGSRDRTWEMIKEASEADPRIKGVKLSRNFGHQLALQAGLDASTGDWIFVIDADLQDPPELLNDMLSVARQGADVVYGQRRSRPGDSFLRRKASDWFYRLMRHMSDVDIPVDTGDFRLMSRRVVDAVKEMPESHRYIRGLVSWAGYRQEPFHYDRDVRVAGESGYTLARLFKFSVDALVGFSEKPLRIATLTGGFFVAMSVVAIIYILGLWLFSDIEVQGWVSIIVTVTFFGGINMMFLGLIGEYIGRIFVQSKNRPLYIVAETSSPVSGSAQK